MLVSDFLVPDMEAVMVMRQIDRHDFVHVVVVAVVVLDDAAVAAAVRIVVGLQIVKIF